MGTTGYWDLTEKQRAALTHDEVTALGAHELMRVGVLAPEPLELLDEPEITAPTRTYYVVSSGQYGQPTVAFENDVQAQAYIALEPMSIDFDYSTKTNYVVPQRELLISIRYHITSEQHAAMRGTYKDRAAAVTENERRREAHREQSEKAAAALSEMWDNWRACQVKARLVHRVLATLVEYTAMAGDENTARRFLRKAFSRAELTTADEWEPGLGLLGPGDQSDLVLPAGVAVALEPMAQRAGGDIPF